MTRALLKASLLVLNTITDRAIKHPDYRTTYALAAAIEAHLKENPPVKLVIHNEEELGDLLEWLGAHERESDWPEGTTFAIEWLTSIELPWGIGRTVTIPPDAVEAIQYAIDDLGEALAANNDEFQTHTSEMKD
jgi:hypothetical protein